VSPAVRLIPASMLIGKPMIGTYPRAQNRLLHWAEQFWGIHYLSHVFLAHLHSMNRSLSLFLWGIPFSWYALCDHLFAIKA
jgi:hypothetical protein